MAIIANLRRATMDDISLLAEWMNVGQSTIGFDYTECGNIQNKIDRLKWLLSYSEVEIYVYADQNRDIGQIRLIPCVDGYEVSYSIAQLYSLSEYVKYMLTLIENFVFESKGTKRLYVQVSYDDIASQLIFQEMGYDRYEGNKYIVYYKYVERQERDEYKKRIDHAVLLLTNNKNALPLYEWLCRHEKNAVVIYSKSVCEESIGFLEPRVVISYNYKYIIDQTVIARMKHAIYNMHISYLPYNRGAQPNFWSFIDNTPKGVTIHRLERELDRGDIICQKQMRFDELRETFSSTYEKLNKEIVTLLEENWESIKNDTIKGKCQANNGSYHNMKDFYLYTEKYPLNWNDNIADYKNRCKKD